MNLSTSSRLNEVKWAEMWTFKFLVFIHVLFKYTNPLPVSS